MNHPDPGFDWCSSALWSPESFGRLSQPADEYWLATEPGPRVLVAAHDAGGAELLAAWIKRRLLRAEAGLAPLLQPTFLLEGPALKIFARAGLADRTGLLPFKLIDREEAFGKHSDWNWVLTGTGWASDLEIWAVKESRQRQLLTCSYLEHWINYQERFASRENEESIFPDQIWVGDPWAEALARTAFGDKSIIRLVPNPYFAEIRADFEKSTANDATIDKTLRQEERPKNGQRMLYVTEPISQVAEAQHGNPRWYGYTEFEALEGFLAWRQNLLADFPAGVLRLRPHPSEASDKYSAILAAQSTPWYLSPAGSTLLQDCLWADVIIGCNTMALVIGWLVDRRLLCSIPAQGPTCSLPLPGIERLFPKKTPNL